MQYSRPHRDIRVVELPGGESLQRYSPHSPHSPQYVSMLRCKARVPHMTCGEGVEAYDGTLLILCIHRQCFCISSTATCRRRIVVRRQVQTKTLRHSYINYGLVEGVETSIGGANISLIRSRDKAFAICRF